MWIDRGLGLLEEDVDLVAEEAGAPQESRRGLHREQRKPHHTLAERGLGRSQPSNPSPPPPTRWFPAIAQSPAPEIFAGVGTSRDHEEELAVRISLSLSRGALSLSLSTWVEVFLFLFYFFDRGGL